MAAHLPDFMPPLHLPSMHIPTETELRSWLTVYGAKVATFADKARNVIALVQANKTAEEIIAHIPEGAQIMAALAKAAPLLAKASQIVPAINLVFTAYDLYEAAGGKPMDWGNPQGETKWLAQHVAETQGLGG